MNKNTQPSLQNINDLDLTTKQHGLSVGLSADEYELIVKLLHKNPNKLELGIFSAMWSEHCSYKSSRRHLKKLPNESDKVLVGPGENAGVIDVGDNLAVAFKVESHNHPSFIEPFQGAATGVGGILRDIFTMGAKPFATMNLLRFGSKNHKKTAHLVSGVVSGISSYGNSFGVCNVVSDVKFDACYNGNILVNAFAIGVMDHGKIFYGTAAGVGNTVYYVGAKTGRDGIHGATMASDEFSDEKEAARPTVQVGDPFKEKLLLEACLECFAKNLVVGIQDMGAAGLTSSSFEMAFRGQSGLRLNLDQVPMREKGMTPYEIMLSESQERMLLVVESKNENELKNTFAKWDLDAVPIGVVTDDGLVSLMWHQELYAALPFALLTDNAPVYDRKFNPPSLSKIPAAELDLSNYSYTDLLLKLIVHPDFSEQSWMQEQYDLHIGLGTLQHQSHSSAALVQIPQSKKAVALSIGCDSRLCAIDPFEAVQRNLARQVLEISVLGAKSLGISDCLNFGSPEESDCMGQMVASIEGLAVAAKCFAIPIVSGNVSLYNQTDNKPIYSTPTIALVGLHEDPVKTSTNSFRNSGDLIVYIGNFASEMTGAELIYEGEVKTNKLHSWDLNQINLLSQSVQKLIVEQVITTADVVQKGGLLLTILKMALKGKRGAVLNFEFKTENILTTCLFSEDAFGLVIAVKATDLAVVQSALANVAAVTVLGEVVGNDFKLAVNNLTMIDLPMSLIAKRHSSAFAEVINAA